MVAVVLLWTLPSRIEDNNLASVDLKCTVKIQAYGDKAVLILGNNVKDMKLARY
jgi:hypothetical protein